MSRPWSTLGLDGPSSLPEIRHAYAERLKTTHPEEDPEGFQELHSAYKLACKLAKKGGGSASNAQAWQTAWEYTPPQVDAPAPQEEEQQQEWDYDALLEDGKKPPREEKQEEEEQREWDYDTLLEDGKKPPREEEQEDEQQEWDYDTLLEDGKKPPREEEQEEAQREWDYDALLEDGKKPPREEQQEEEQQEWDYDALFHQARTDEEKSYLRRRNALREKHCERYRRWPGKDRGQTESEEEAWLRVLAALRQMEWLCVTGAPTEIWEQFIASDLFSAVMRDPDLVFGLEELLAEHPEISRRVRKTLRTAYSAIDGGVFYGREYTPLRDLLVAGRPKAGRPKAGRPKKEWSVRRAYSVLFGVLLSAMTLFVVFGRQSEDKKVPDDIPAFTQSREYHNVTCSYKVDSTFERTGESSFYDARIDASYEFGTELGMNERSALSKLTELVGDYRMDENFIDFDFAYPEAESVMVPLTAADGSIYQHAMLSLSFAEDGGESMIHLGIALSEDGVLITVMAHHSDGQDAEAVKDNIVKILKSTVLSNPNSVTEENYRSLFHLAEEYGYKLVGQGYIKTPYELFDKDGFADVFIPYSEDAEYLEDGYAIRSAAHGMEIYHTIIRSEENAMAVVEQAFEALAASGVELYEDGVYDTDYVPKHDSAYKQVSYFADNGEKERLSFLCARVKEAGYYQFTQITYIPEHMDEEYPALVEELGDALTLSLPQL